ncbi:cytochrome c, partial [Thioclava sp. BHET1]
ASMAGGYAIASPMGNIIASNITPSTSDGIGNWTEAQFARAIREGVAPGGKHLYPAMPYPSYAKMTDADVKALYAYFMKEVKPVDAAPKAKTDLSFPFNERALMIGWNLLFAPSPGWTPPSDLNKEQQRGAYLVQALAHCSTCHTSRGPMMNTQGSKFLGGAALSGWRAPNITPDKASGIGDWSQQDIVTYLKTGALGNTATAAGPMAEAVTHSFRYLKDSDLQAIAAYLKTVKPLHSPEDALSATPVSAPAIPVQSYEPANWTGS